MEYFLLLANMLLTFIPAHAVRLFPMWKARNVKARTIFVYIACITLLQSIGLFLANNIWHFDLVALGHYELLAGIPMIAVPFFIFRKKVWQNIFLVFLNLAFSLVYSGIGRYAGMNFLGSWENPTLVADIFSFIAIALTLPPLLYVLRRLCGNPSMEQSSVFWRMAWILPAILFAIMLRDTVLFGLEASPSIIINRVLLYVALTTVCFLLDAAVRQISEVEAAKHEVEKLSIKTESLDRLNHSKTEFLQDMSHEMRNPLTVIATGIDYTDKEINRDSGSMQNASLALDVIRHETQRLGRMVAGMVTMASIIETDEKRTRAQFATLLLRSAESLRLVAEQKGNTLLVETQDGLSDVYIESDNYMRVVTNLLSNAIDHTQNGKISVTAKTDNSYIVVSVTDTGEGMPPEILQNVFDRGTSSKGSTGYGLYLSKAAVEAHGGTITVESDPGEGTVVTFTIPVYSGQEEGHDI
ncbi:hypothetical protein FACS1894185_3950 [Betaproteobacteria bacterium]|nr:hypothetical protein FACS1894185_3950 [Betaproteobacteria bacterium]